MMRFLVPAGFLLLVGLFWLTLDRISEGEYNPRDIPTQFIGRQAPAIDVPDLFNPDITVKTADMKDQVWVLNVWGTWCNECLREHEFLVHLARDKKIPIVGINWRDQASDAKAMLARMGNPFMRLGFDPKSKVAINWGVYGAPETFLIDANGVIREKHAGSLNANIWEKQFSHYFTTTGKDS